MDPQLPPPDDLDAPIRELVGALAHRVGEREAVAMCTDLLLGAPAAAYPTVLPYLAGWPAHSLLEGRWADYWGRTWGARALLYIWDEPAAGAVVRGLDDPHWRPAESCLRVAAAREVVEAVDGAVRLAGHHLPRVRAAALRTLGRVGDTEHVTVVRRGLADPHVDVRRAAGLALERMAGRLDLGPDLLP